MKVTKSISYEEYQQLLEDSDRYKELSEFLRMMVEERAIEEVNPVTSSRRRYISLTDWNTMKLFELLHRNTQKKGDEEKWENIWTKQLDA